VTGTMTTRDGLALRVRLDLPERGAVARVILVHGIGDHVDGLPYATAAAALSRRGLAVHRLELRGHGLSGGRRVYVDTFADFREDLAGFVSGTSACEPPLPLFLVGVSLGGLIVTDQALHHPDGLRGVVAVAPALGETGGSRFLRACLPLLARLLPTLRLDPKLDLERLTRDRALLKAYVTDDPLYQTKLTPRIAAEVLAAIAATRARAGELRVPLFVQHGTADTVTSARDSEEFVRRAGVGDKAFKGYEGAYHNLFVETNREEVFDDLAAWILARSGAGGR
jgi:alpha-beta hydrolase superfamily lysophospholipase